MVTETKPLAPLLKLPDESVVGLAGNVEPEAFDAQGAQAGQVVQIQPLHPAAFRIAGAPAAGDDDLFHAPSCNCTTRAYRPPFATNSACVPCSTISPSC